MLIGDGLTVAHLTAGDPAVKHERRARDVRTVIAREEGDGPADAFMRHLPKKYSKALQFVTVNGRQKLAIGGQISDYIPNPTFDVVAAPGAHLKYYRGENTEGLSLREITGPAIEATPSFRKGADRVLFGSDWPHPEGVVEPLDFLGELTELSAADQQKIMSSNLKGLLEGARD
jgi:hypothetical protein